MPGGGYCQLAEIFDAYAAMETAEAAESTAIEADLRFHRAILAAARNDLLLQMRKLHIIPAALALTLCASGGAIASEQCLMAAKATSW